MEESEKANDPLTLAVVLTNLLATLPAHVYWKNRDGIYLGCNEGQAKSLGLSTSREVIGKTDFELPWSAELAKRFWENDLAVLETGQAKTIEEMALVNGESGVVLSLKAPIRAGKGEVVGVLGISLNITEQKRLEQRLVEAIDALEVASQAKQEFLNNMRHDMRTPLSGILGCAKIIQNIATDANIKNYASDLVYSSHALTHLLNQVLEAVNVGGHYLRLLKKRFNVRELVDQVITLNLAKARQKGLPLSCIQDPHGPPYLIGDPVRIQRILLELVTNALNFTEKGSVRIEINIIKQCKRHVILKLTVQDTGIGIAPDKQDQIFTAFKRMTPACQGIYPGSGLGLSILKQLLEEMDGELYFKSVLGQGSCFTCVLPLKIALLTEAGEDSACLNAPPTFI